MDRLVLTTDTFGRPLRSLRVSVTDRCNLRCAYCMPEEHYVWLPRADLLRFEEVGRLVAALQPLGLTKVRLTGGEPLQRVELPTLVRILAGLGLADLAMTTNGVQLAEHADALREAGLRRVTISLDTLDRARLTADGMWLQCLYARVGVDLRGPLRAGASDAELRAIVAAAWGARRDRGAEQRLAEGERGPLIAADALKRQPHLEMHTRGG